MGIGAVRLGRPQRRHRRLERRAGRRAQERRPLAVGGPRRLAGGPGARYHVRAPVIIVQEEAPVRNDGELAVAFPVGGRAGRSGDRRRGEGQDDGQRGGPHLEEFLQQLRPVVARFVDGRAHRVSVQEPFGGGGE